MKNQDRTSKYSSTFDKIYEQKLVLNNLADLFKEFKDNDSAALEADLQNIKKVYDGITDPVQINKETLQKIAAAVGAARNNATK
jgi:hypothetical protein